MRHVCSTASKNIKELDRPTEAGRILYKDSKDQFLQNHSNYLEMIIGVLKDYYNDEYEMLTMLANDDISTFNEFANLHSSYTSHLIGYGLVKKENNRYDFNIDSIRDFILEKSKYKKINMTQEEMWHEISQRRNKAEINLRRVIKFSLKSNHGTQQAKNIVLEIFGSPRKSKLSHLNFDELFDTSKSEIYFSDLSKIISKEWDIFKNIFERSRQETFTNLEFINKSRVDAHAKKITKEQFSYFRICIKNIEDDVLEALS